MDEQYSQLIHTKLCIPRLRSRIVDRKRLMERAAPEPGVVLTLVSAPAGYGKTTLMVELSQALAEAGTAVAWYALDSSDNDPNLFGSYLLASLGQALQIDSDLGSAARLLRSSTEDSLEKTLPAIINGLASRNRGCLLVLDDYHHITSPAIHSALTFLLDHAPHDLHVIIGSRSDPPLPLARLRARGQMAEIRAADLRFTRQETAQFLNETMRLGLPSETVAAIEASTEGWITGLQLAALSIMGRPQESPAVSSFDASNRYLVDYLLQEVVERQPADLQEFLLSTSILDRLCSPLCDAILDGRLDSGSVLHQLEHANLFLISLDEKGYWYRYHHLFRDFLRARLKQRDPSRIPHLHQAASDWYSSQQLLREAVSHALEARDWDYAAGVVEQHGLQMFMRSEIAILHKWCEGFPEEVFSAHPLLCILQGWALGLSYRQEHRGQVEIRLQQAEQAASALADKQRGRWLTGQAALVRLSLSLIPDPTADPERARVLAKGALDILPGNDPGRSLATSALGYAYLSLQDIPLARRTLEEYRSQALAGGFYYGAIAATFHLASLAYYQGQPKRAMELCDEVQASIAAVVASPEKDLPAIGSLDVIRGCILLEKNRLEEAERVLLHGLGLVGWTNNPFIRMIACLALFRVHQIGGRNEEAVRFLQDIEGAWPDIAFLTRGSKLVHQVRRDPDNPQTLAQVESWCTGISWSFGEDMRLPGVGPMGGAQAYYLASLIWVQAKVLMGKPEETLSYLGRQRRVAEEQGLVHRLIELSLAEAQARKAMGEDQRAFQLLEHALTLAQTAGCLRVFDQGPALTRLLKEAAHHGIDRGHVEDILRAIDASPGQVPEQHGRPAVSVNRLADTEGYLEPLSEREMEVLRLMARGASNQDTADRLMITVGTVKSHVNHILGKLGVHNRLEAVARAREMGILP